MPLIALVCAGLLGMVDTTTPPTAVVAEYHQVKASSGHSSDDQVRLALWCEAHGLTAERLKHLALAVLADPTNATARGLSGLIARNGQWVAPQEVAQTVRADEAAAALRAEYDLKRSETPYTASAQLALANWADKRGLKDQAKAHYTVVTRLDPHREAAWHRLGYKKVGGHWETEAQAQANRLEIEAQKQADKLWNPILLKARTMLTHASDRAEAEATLAKVNDPRAFHTIRMVFGHGGTADQSVAVQLLDQIEGGAATLALADLAVHSRSGDVRQSAIAKLVKRDPRDCLDTLVKQIKEPFKYEVKPITGPGSVGGLFVEGERVNVEHLYAPPSGPTRPSTFGDMSKPANMERMINSEITVNNLKIARQALDQKVREVEQANARINASNARVELVLTRITGQHFGNDREDWARWNTERVGFAYQTASTEKPTLTVIPQMDYQSQVTIPVPPRVHTACFAAGTPVRTIDGTKPIELVEPGDMVLAQNTTSGALSYQPVLTAAHNPPSATYRVRVDGEEIVATGIHRFWRAGIGWTMARDLKPGDTLRMIGGIATVEGVTPEVTQPVYNLEVADGRSFFVGRVGALVHDNTLVEATPHPFDAPKAVAAAQ